MQAIPVPQRIPAVVGAICPACRSLLVLQWRKQKWFVRRPWIPAYWCGTCKHQVKPARVTTMEGLNGNA